ncbi:thiamine/thiamine pyrophosphate ABC transporter permease ThiP [Rhodobacter sp. Har01]|uniref:thiamine/thiamine pyrophosphate ABC transporter permease ThiP n=1 Tax=Rhodobacter sp. Har01 TaxID=2883999 RepID=UPI001D07193F|nr:thiamine/thiamine pyrophosphate ABC transporter permease ThiP [Rhodobacter sp. Har01]MCB6177870.1 thiamine/thiamine pyrophosphate ABC transporter permease ThiP [Rhodobacter sp. Har01]
MASGARAIGALALLLVAAPLVAVAWAAGGVSLSAADWAALRFTVLQATVSSVVSVLLAVPVAKALARRRFPGRGALITLMGAPSLLPVIVAVLGLVAVYGRAGWLNDGLAAAGLPRVQVYGLQGVVMAHVFLNLPLATRMLLQGWQAIPAERFRLAESLSFRPADVARHLERPMLAEVVPGALATVFAVCLTSFAVALVLGGGPRATTLELAIYQAVRFDFDLGHAAGLALVQTALGAAAALAAWRMAQAAGFGAGLDRAPMWRGPDGWRRGADVLALGLAAAFLLVPMVAILLRGLPGLADLPPEVWAAAGRSVTVALVSTAATMTAALTLAVAVARGGARWLDLAAALPLATSGLVLGTGLFLIAQPIVPPTRLALPVTVLVNALLALPFAFRLLLPEARALHAGYGRLAESLGLQGPARLRLLTLPRLARPLGFSAGLTAALSMGDLGVIALFAADQGATLPLMVQRLMGAYRTEAAAGAALLLVGLSFALFWAFDAGGRRAAA